ncbi:hypothetical protein EDEG_02074 [Edhazardia aedis USNM 41457]|uniref:J domain-containing protein n=1 Tax=Edhazardia aedis (strain USNM 41457) TaxID=1003232 RepID=J9D757_EDHAE|nr:hypothetical protein EDEG_02074 [Edhazardia aedis USNM 41457]|eukprot:EJW03606.1 hypothetical protein EDEG_02074 [Edhazardia aedis USNM 41457]
MFHLPLLFTLLYTKNTTINDSMRTVEEGIERLRLTPYSTFYELFDITPLATKRQITKGFRKRMLQKKTLGTMNLDETNELITSAFTILTKYRKTYDFLLGNTSVPSDIGSTSLVYLVLVGLFALIFADFCQLFYFYTKQQQFDKKEMKKRIKKGEVERKLSYELLYTFRICRKVVSLFYRN